ncbi:C-X-C chemokine receptor type 5 [Seriola lalandi dorsalis]|uniref:C-X-C motif chemokine receptor 5 n=2 Tax=Seriola TaxID=8160 RepID=A0A3B4X4Q6_SERLL|nr:C-X-C chemokine receptor type 5 [Seriola lalandi dorsalis]XP_056229752.1 C-X-C chemokine receptor type 5 isoform X1 [Seriola aureovittata]
MAVTHIFEEFEMTYIGDLDNDTDYIFWNTTDDQSGFCDEENLGLQTFDAVLHSLIFLLGVVGNGLMITVLLRRWRLLRITEIYLLHLALADLMLLFTFPFSLADKASGWVFGEVLCKLIELMKNLNLLCGSFLLACIGFDRYLAIVHAIPSMRSRRPQIVQLTCILLWLVCLALSVPNIVFLAVKEEHTNTSRLSCFYYNYNINAHNWVLTKRVLDHICFFLPLAVMSYCYTALAVTLCKSQKSQAKQGAIRLALIVTLVFCFCWLPYNITLVIQTMVDLKGISFDDCKSYDLLQIALDVTKSLGLSHCCLNPFLYAFVGVQFRNELIRLLFELGCRRVCLPFIRYQGHSRPSISDAATTTSAVLI